MTLCRVVVLTDSEQAPRDLSGGFHYFSTSLLSLLRLSWPSTRAHGAKPLTKISSKALLMASPSPAMAASSLLQNSRSSPTLTPPISGLCASTRKALSTQPAAPPQRSSALKAIVRANPRPFSNPPTWWPRLSPSTLKTRSTLPRLLTARSIASRDPEKKPSSSIPNRSTSGTSPSRRTELSSLRPATKGKSLRSPLTERANYFTPATKRTSACSRSIRTTISLPGRSPAAAFCASTALKIGDEKKMIPQLKVSCFTKLASEKSPP